MNKKKFIIFGLTAFFLFAFITLCYLRYRNFHTEPFIANGTKDAVLFLEKGNFNDPKPEFVDTTQVTIDGVITDPPFRDDFFTGTIKIDYVFDGEIRIIPMLKKISIQTDGKITRFFTTCPLMDKQGRQLFTNIRMWYFFSVDQTNEVILLSFFKDDISIKYWIVTETTDEKLARDILEEFWRVIAAEILVKKTASFFVCTSQQKLDTKIVFLDIQSANVILSHMLPCTTWVLNSPVNTQTVPH